MVSPGLENNQPVGQKLVQYTIWMTKKDIFSCTQIQNNVCIFSPRCIVKKLDYVEIAQNIRKKERKVSFFSGKYWFSFQNAGLIGILFVSAVWTHLKCTMFVLESKTESVWSGLRPDGKAICLPTGLKLSGAFREISISPHPKDKYEGMSQVYFVILLSARLMWDSVWSPARKCKHIH